jgi:hypothetical protein
MVPKCVAGDSIQPRPGILKGEVVVPSTSEGSDERIGKQVINVRMVGTFRQISMQSAGMAFKDQSELARIVERKSD